jgi:Fe-Mn family superoxide dismutase
MHTSNKKGTMQYTLPPLPYRYDALEPYIDAQTMELHYTKHHQTYTDELNKALAQHPEITAPIEHVLENIDTVPADIRAAIRNHGGGFVNHSLLWLWMKPQGGGVPLGKISTALTQRFDTFENFQAQFTTAARTRFGSGWAWLVLNKAGDLDIMSTANQDSPLSEGCKPLLGIDVWEHAYYLKYQNKRVAYIDAWWNTINWPYVDELYRGG